MTPLPTILVINLDRDADRLAHMHAELDRLKLPFVRCAGVLGEQVPPSLRANFFDGDGHPVSTLKRGEVGCYASHLAIYERLVAGEFGSAAVVLEDDVEIDSDFEGVVRAALKVLPPDWDIVRLSNTPKRAYVPITPLVAGRSLVRYSNIPNGTGAYLISRAGARKLIGPRPRRRAIDEDLRRAHEVALETFGVVPSPVTPDVLASTIDDLEAGRHDKKAGAPARLAVFSRSRAAVDRLAFNMRVLGPARWAGCAIANGLDRIGRRTRAPSVLPQAARWLGSDSIP